MYIDNCKLQELNNDKLFNFLDLLFIDKSTVEVGKDFIAYEDNSWLIRTSEKVFLYTTEKEILTDTVNILTRIEEKL